MIIFRREWRRNFKSLLIWSISISLMIFLIMSLYKSFSEGFSGQSIQDLLEAYPEGLKAAFGLNSLDMSNILGYYGIESYLMVTLFGAIFAMLLSGSIISKEEHEKTIEFLLAKPVKRLEILTSKIGLVIFNIFLFNLINSLVTFTAFEIYKTADYDQSIFFLLMLGPLLLHLTFASLGLLISVFITKTKAIYSVSIGLVLVAYFFSIIANISDKLKFLKHFSPFSYIDATDIILNGKLHLNYLLVMIFTIIIGIGLTFLFYNKKDITI